MRGGKQKQRRTEKNNDGQQGFGKSWALVKNPSSNQTGGGKGKIAKKKPKKGR